MCNTLNSHLNITRMTMIKSKFHKNYEIRMSQTLEPSRSETQTTITLSLFISWAKLRRKNSQVMPWGLKN